MTKETFSKLTSGVLGLSCSSVKTEERRAATPASDIINCIRHWRHKVPIPVRLLVVLDDGEVLDCRFPSEVDLWKAIARRGLLANVSKLIPDDLRDKIHPW